MCLYSPCIENVNATLYPMSYDLKLGDFCYESTGRSKYILIKDEVRIHFTKVNVIVTLDNNNFHNNNTFHPVLLSFSFN